MRIKGKVSKVVSGVAGIEPVRHRPAQPGKAVGKDKKGYQGMAFDDEADPVHSYLLWLNGCSLPRVR
jgi:hypothetical protein